MKCAEQKVFPTVYVRLPGLVPLSARPHASNAEADRFCHGSMCKLQVAISFCSGTTGGGEAAIKTPNESVTRRQVHLWV